jgi:hypothetical protein
MLKVLNRFPKMSILPSLGQQKDNMNLFNKLQLKKKEAKDKNCRDHMMRIGRG